jgi:hypothetical protein
MQFLAFNIVLFLVSYIIDIIAINYFGVVAWRREFLEYYLFVNIPISALSTVLIINTIKSKFNT